MAPSPTAVAQRLIEPERTSPAAYTPGTLVSSSLVGTGVGAREDEAVLVARDRVAQPLRARRRAEEQEQGRDRQPLAVAAA